MSRAPPPQQRGPPQQQYYNSRPPQQHAGYDDGYGQQGYQQDWQQNGYDGGYESRGNPSYDQHYGQQDPYYANNGYYGDSYERPPPDSNWNRRPGPPPQQRMRGPPPLRGPPPRGPPPQSAQYDGYGSGSGQQQYPPQSPPAGAYGHRPQGPPPSGPQSNGYGPRPQDPRQRGPPPPQENRRFQDIPGSYDGAYPTQPRASADQARPDPRAEYGHPSQRPDPRTRQNSGREDQHQGFGGYGADAGGYGDQREQYPPPNDPRDGRNRGPLPDFTSVKNRTFDQRPGTATGVRSPPPRQPLPPQSFTQPPTPIDGSFSNQMNQVPSGQRRQPPAPLQGLPPAGTNFSLPSRPGTAPANYPQNDPMPNYEEARSPNGALARPPHRPNDAQQQQSEYGADRNQQFGTMPNPPPMRSQTAAASYQDPGQPQSRPGPMQRQMTDGPYYNGASARMGSGAPQSQSSRPSLDSRRPPMNGFGSEDAALSPPMRQNSSMTDPQGRPRTPLGARPSTANVERPGFYPGAAAGAVSQSGAKAQGDFPPRGASQTASATATNPNNPVPKKADPDALPYHPTPVRPGLDQNGSGEQKKPPPVRQYSDSKTDPAKATQAKRQSNPVTQAELDSLRGAVMRAPANHALHLKLAKKLVEASRVLADEGGRADQKTKRNNQERYISEAYKLVKKLVNMNYPEAMFYLADCYGEGSLGLQQDPKEAFLLYQGAAKLGHAQAAYRTAVCCEIGVEQGGGTKRDYQKSLQWYKRSASLGDVPATYKLGVILLKGLLGQERNVNEAVVYLKKAAERADEENPHALHELGLLYEAPSGALQRDQQYALDLFTKAAKLGYRASQFRLGQCYEHGQLGCPVDARNSIIWYTKAAAQGEHQSELALSGWYLTGAEGILEHSDTEAYLWARKAASAANPLPKAMFAMGYFTEVGIGCPRSLEEAKRWYGRAAAHNFPKARERLEELRKGGAKAQKSRERLSRTNQKQQEADCRVM